jgi:hypothetical protein
MKITSAILLFSLAGVLSLSHVAAEEGLACAEFCMSEFAPVCGTDGKQYGNACELGIVSCKNPTLELSVNYEGMCEQPTQTPRPASAACPTLCTKDVFKQCGSDGKTYTNACAFALAQCKDPNLQFQSQGACPKQA